MMAGVLALALVFATQVVAGFVVLRLTRCDATGVRAWARALLFGPAGLALQMLAYGAAGVPFHLGFVLAPWWVALALCRREGAAAVPRLRGCLLSSAIAVQAAVVFAVAPTAPVLASDAMHNHALPGKVFAAHRGLAPGALAALSDPGNVVYPPLVAFGDALLFLADEDLGVFAVPLFGAAAFLAWGLLIHEVLNRPRARVLAASAGVLVLATPEAVANSLDGFADLRFAATLLLLAVEARRVVGRAAPGIAPVAAAAVAAGLTKVEGQVAAALVCTWLLFGRGWHGLRAGVVIAPVAAVVIAVAAWPCFARLAALPSEVEVVEPIPALVPLALGSLRATSGLFAAAFDVDAAGVPRFGLLWPVALTAGAFVAACRRDRMSLGLLALMLGHAGAYGLVLATLAAVTPVDLEWTLPATRDRLLLHLLPWVVLLLGRVLDAAGATEGEDLVATITGGKP